MGKTGKWIIGILATLAITTMIAGGASNLVGFSDKFQLYTGTPQIHDFSNGSVNLKLPNIRIMNQSNVTANLTNLFISIQYFDKPSQSWKNWILQTNSIPAFELKANQLNTLPTINLAIPLSLDFVTNAIKGNIGNELKVVTRFNFYGLAIPLEEKIDASALINQFKKFSWVAA